MSKQSLLLVDGDTRSLRVLEVSLRKAGFTVTPAVSVKDALDKLELHTPDLIISETQFPTDHDGFELRRRVRAVTDWAEIPFVFLTTETAIENKIRGLELGVEDYLTKPIYIKEIVTRINILLQKKQRAGFDDRKDGMRFAGRVADMPVVDVIQTIEVSRKSGVIQFVGTNARQAAIYFRDGKVIDAEAGTLQGEDAVYRLLTWSDGDFEVVFRTVRRREAIATSSQGLLMEGMRRLDEWSRLLEQLPPLAHRFEIDIGELATRLGEVPDDNNRILRLVDGKRTLLEVIDASDFGDLECLQVIARLFFEGLLIDLDPDLKPKRDTGKLMPLVVVDELTPMEEVASGPIHIANLAARAEAEERRLVVVPVLEPSEPEPELKRAAKPEPEPELEADRVDDVDAIVEEEPLPPEPLLGSYRPSSLRLIDEAVAAAQAIEPSLFEPEELVAAGVVVAPVAAEMAASVSVDGAAPVAKMRLERREPDPRVASARALVEKMPGDPEYDTEQVAPNGGATGPGVIELIQDLTALARADEEAASGVPKAIEVEEPTPLPPRAVREPDDDSEELRRFASATRKDESGLRMIGSLGRDRAEASGEVRLPLRPPEPPSVEPMRELVTIMPRRKTGEFPVPPSVDASLSDAPLPEVPAVAPVEPPEEPPSEPASEEPVETPSLPRPRRVSVAGGVVRKRGPGPGAASLLVAASLLSGATAYTYCHKQLAARHAANIDHDDARLGGTLPPLLADAPELALSADAAMVRPRTADAAVAVRMPAPDAAAVHAPAIDAAVAVHVPPADAAVEVHAPAQDADAVARTPAVDASIDKKKLASELTQQAQSALDDGDPDKALALTDEALKLRRTQSTLLVRARSLQRLDRIDEALREVDEAIDIDGKYPPAWETRALILWGVHRFDEARVAMQKYVDIDPQGRSADSFRHLIDQK